MVSTNRIFSSYSVVDVDTTEAFYRDTLGLDARATPGGVHLHVGGEPVFLYPKGEAHTPATFTVLYLEVPDLDAAVAELEGAGVTFERYPGWEQDEHGIARSPDPSRGPSLAWLTDPSGNIIALAQG